MGGRRGRRERRTPAVERSQSRCEVPNCASEESKCRNADLDAVRESERL